MKIQGQRNLVRDEGFEGYGLGQEFGLGTWSGLRVIGLGQDYGLGEGSGFGSGLIIWDY